MNKKILLEYIWIDGSNELRSKIKIMEWDTDKNIEITMIPEWNFDGSSTSQAEGKDSDVIIRPCALYLNPFVNYMRGYFVMCDCWNKDGTPHETNHRVKLVETFNKCELYEPLFGIEQEYVIFERVSKLKDKIIDDGGIIYKLSKHNPEPIPYKWIEHDNPGSGSQGPYYCGVGGGVCFGREISEKHLEFCLKAGISICGTNAEVMGSQWEYQIGALNPLETSDQLWVSRYILHKISEQFNCVISFHPKPYPGDWNGSGGHTNFSTREMREIGGLDKIENACKKLALTHKSHMEVYGKYNEYRLTGLHETSSIDDFSWGISNRGKSIRIPLHVANNKCGYLEDRRPAANLDPYLVCEKICSTVCQD
jgi:glutamine synthetase